MYLAAAAKFLAPATSGHLKTACCAPHFSVSSLVSTLQQNITLLRVDSCHECAWQRLTGCRFQLNVICSCLFVLTSGEI